MTAFISIETVWCLGIINLHIYERKMRKRILPYKLVGYNQEAYTSVSCDSCL